MLSTIGPGLSVNQQIHYSLSGAAIKRAAATSQRGLQLWQEHRSLRKQRALQKRQSANAQRALTDEGAARLWRSQTSRPHLVSAAAGCLMMAPAMMPLALSVAWTDVAMAESTQAATSVQAIDSDPRALALVTEMSEAIQALTYTGTFVHMHNNNLETMRILHANVDGTEKERMISLNGEAREVFRDHLQVTCIWPGSQSVIVGKSKPRDIIQRVNENLTDAGLYAFALERDDRVAGRSTRVVRVMPKDSFRYGYRFWIDAENGMLLRLVLLNEQEQPLEQLVFTDIAYPDSIPDSELVASMATDSFSWTEAADSPNDGSAALPKRVVFEALPGGYEKVAETFEPMPIDKVPLSHVTLSDGMASVSVYVEHIPRERHNADATGVSSMGAVNAFGHSTEQAFITVVGEVPVDAVQHIAMSVSIVDNN